MLITNSEIENAGILLLNDKNAFYDNDIGEKTGERIEAIKLFESKNIVACPGSGKTTTLLAKLIVLANKMPFQDGRGICVFTHTNVAIDKIKKDLGPKSDILFRYPNFFGTIQSFINKYLAIPSYINKNGFRPIIDNDKYYDAVQKYYKNSGILVKFKPWIQAQVMYSDIEPYLFIGHLRFKYSNPEIIAKNLFKDAFVDVDKNHYKAIWQFKRMIYNYGFLPFDEAYTEANDYLSNNGKIISAISSRFKYVFVDEMQDTGAHQMKIINDLFEGDTNVVYQCYGDPNQAIYNDNKFEGSWKPNSENSIYISETKRFSESICQCINTLRINYHNEPKLITSSSIKTSKNSQIILFDDDKIEHVIKKYAEIIHSSRIDNENGFYAIGRIIKKPKNGKFSIKSYFPEFERNYKTANNVHTNLESYLNFNENHNIHMQSSILFNSILYLLDINNITNPKTRRKFTKTTLLNYIKDNNEELSIKLKTNVIKWLKLINSDINNLENVKNMIALFYEVFFKKIWNIELSTTDKFFTEKPSQTRESIGSKQLNQKEIIVNHGEADEVKIPINVNTINGEKGKTHTATLYLETFNRVYDVEKVITFLYGEEIQLIKTGVNAGKINESKTPSVQLKYAYVGMSRPTDLLCVALRKSVVTTEIKANLISSGWIINEELC